MIIERSIQRSIEHSTNDQSKSQTTILEITTIFGTNERVIAKLHMTVRIEKNVGRLDVAMENISRMHEMQGPKNLIDNVLMVSS